MTLNDIIRNSNNISNSEKHLLRELLLELLNCQLCSKIWKTVADKLYHAQHISYNLFAKFTDILYNTIITNRGK